jgi:hypothetical protein
MPAKADDASVFIDIIGMPLIPTVKSLDS